MSPAADPAALQSGAMVIGIGNVLRRDDGIGVRVAERLADRNRLNCPVVDGGTGGLGLLDWLIGSERVFVVDAVQMGREPGAVALIAEDRLRSMAGSLTAGHAMGLVEVLGLRRSLGYANRVDVVGVQPHTVDLAPSLSAELEGGLESIADRVETIILSELSARAEEE